MFDFSIDSIVGYLYAIPGILFALSIHEFSHGFVANKLGDPTAKSMGRLTLNPVKHIDIFGLIAMFLVHIGWAKPVPVNTRYFKKPRRDMALTAIAGPLSNLLSAFVGMIIYYFFIFFVFMNPTLIRKEILDGLIMIFQNFMYLNIGFAIFNMIPIPPLDGSRILDSFLPPKALIAYHKYEDIIRIILLAVLLFDLVSIAPIIDFVFDKMAIAVDTVCGFILNLFI